jgi:D-glycero-D-manno-heptose 1,7-bisphosphate phosphatase
MPSSANNDERPGRQCVILVGGRGTRLGAVTQSIPKPLVAVGDRPFLAYLVAEARRHGFTRIVLLAGYLSDALEDAARSWAGQYPDLAIDVVVEPEPLGTAGAVRRVLDRLAPEFLLINGDSIFDINLLDLATRPVAGDWMARLALKPGMDPARYGSVVLDGDRIAAFAEKNPGPQRATVNGGVYWIRREAIARMPAGSASIERDVFPRLAAEGLLWGFAYDRFMIDIGLPESLAEANSVVPARLRRPAVFFDRDGVLNVDKNYVHRPDQFEWIDGAISTIKAVNDSGRFAFVVTNQAGVGRGYYDEATVQALHRWMNAELRRQGAHIDAFAYCPHHPDAGCACRKPQPGMLAGLMRDWPVDADASIMIGDRDIDMGAAAAAGVRGVLFEGRDLPGLARSAMGA